MSGHGSQRSFWEKGTIPPREGVSSPAAVEELAAEAAGRVREAGEGLLKESKPWGEFVDREALGKPGTVAEAVSRLRANAGYFRVNYAIVLFTTVLVFLLAKPSAILWIALVAAGWLYLFVLQPGPLTLGGRTFGHNEKLMGASAGSLLIIFFLTNVASVIFSALAVGCFAVAVHGALRVPDNLFIDDGEQPGGGGGFLGGLFSGGGGGLGAEVPRARGNPPPPRRGTSSSRPSITPPPLCSGARAASPAKGATGGGPRTSSTRTQIRRTTRSWP